MGLEEELGKLEKEWYEEVVKFIKRNETTLELAIDMIETKNLDTKSFVAGFIAGKLISLMQYFFFIPNMDGTFTAQPNLHRVYIDFERFIRTANKVFAKENKEESNDIEFGGEVF